MSPMLAGITGPQDLRSLPTSALTELGAELRTELISTVSRTGGHLGPNLGVVELTIAVHRVFRSPFDAIVWDTGHQANVHKMLTGRQKALPGLRQAGGLSGYPGRAESVHDLVENSHASTVVGDGALTGGMCWEALNNIAAAPHRPVVIVLNDNGRSYAPTVGALAAHLGELRVASGYPAVLFEQLGLAYVGPVDGHDIAAVEAALEQARRLGRPTVVHCVTCKGRGHQPAETDEADRLHSIGPAIIQPEMMEPDTADPVTRAGAPSWTSVFGAELCRLGQERADVVAVTAAMLRRAGLHPFTTAFPDRVFDVGIAEQHAVTSAAGLAMGGLHPVVAIYATFLNRAFDQVLMDVGLHRLPVTFVLDRAGVTGSDGPSHNGMWDLSLLGIVPGLRVAAPRDAPRLRKLLGEAVGDDEGPTALRFPKGCLRRELPALGRLGNADVLRRSGRRPDHRRGSTLAATGRTRAGRRRQSLPAGRDRGGQRSRRRVRRCLGAGAPRRAALRRGAGRCAAWRWSRNSCRTASATTYSPIIDCPRTGSRGASSVGCGPATSVRWVERGPLQLMQISPECGLVGR